MDELLKIIIECNKKRKILGPDDVKQICDIVINNKHQLIKHIFFFNTNPSDSHCAAVYYHDNLYFFMNETEELIDTCYQNLINKYQLDGAKIDVYNYFYLCIIFHELMHVRQHYYTKKNDGKLETKLFSMCLELSLNRQLYQSNYLNFLTEVDANNRASIKANSLYHHLPLEYISPNDLVAYDAIMLKEMLRDNYDVEPKKELIISPFDKLMVGAMEKIKDFEINKYLKLVEEHQDITLYRKLLLGLPITYMEYAYTNLLYDIIQSGEEINIIKKLQKKIK